MAMRAVFSYLVLAVGLTLASGSPGLAAAKSGFLGTFGSWDAFVSRVGGVKACYAASAPKKSEGKYKKRGAASVIVTHWPGRKRFDEVSIVAGYVYKKDSEVTVRIGNRTYKLYTDGDRAWRYTAKEDRELVRAMQKGMTMVVIGRSSRGTRTRDTYSLKGFTAAHRAIDKACRGK